MRTTVIFNAKGGVGKTITTINMAAELAAVVGLIYAQFCQTGTSAGADFRDALTAMTREDAAIWTAADTTIKGGYGHCIVYATPETEENYGNDA